MAADYFRYRPEREKTHAKEQSRKVIMIFLKRLHLCIWSNCEQLDPEYLAFLETLKNPVLDHLPSAEVQLEKRLQEEKEVGCVVFQFC